MALPLLPLLGAAAKGLGSGMARGAAKNFITGKKRDKKPVEQKKPDNNQSMSGEKGSLTLRPKVSLIPSETFATPETETTESKSRTRTSDPLKLIKIKVLKIDKILKKRYTSDLKKTKTLKRIREDTRRKNQEQQLEKVDPTGKKDGNTKKLNLPGKGLFSGIFNFLKNILLGRLLVLLLEARPNLPGGNILMFIANTAEKIIDLIIGAIDGFGSFLLAGKNVIDSSKEWLKNNRGPEAEERFNELLKSLTSVFNAIVIVGSVFAVGKGIGAKKDKLDKGKDPRRTKGSKEKVRPDKKTRTRRASKEARKRYARRFGKDAAKQRFAGQTRGPIKSSLTRRGLGQASGRGALKILGKSGVQAIKGIAKGFSRIPIFGPIVVAVSSLLVGEPIGQALFKGFGAALGGVLGSFIPIPVIGTILGETIGVLIGDMMYSLIMGKGPAEAGQKFMNALKTALDVGGLILKFVGDGFKKFSNKFFETDPIKIAEGMGRRSAATKIVEILGLKDFLKDRGYIDSKDQVTKFPNILNLFNPLVSVPMLAGSFFGGIFKGGGATSKSSDLAPEGTDRSGARGTGSLGLGSENAVSSLTMVEGGSLKGLTEKDYADLAFIVSGEAQRGTDDEYGVAAAVLNRVSDPRYPNNIQAVGAAPGQFEAVFKGLAYYDEGLIKKLMSPEGQAKIVDALIKLKGRTDFKGTSMYQYMGQGDVKFSSRGNFYHYPEQREKSDPPPASIPNFYQSLIDKSGAIGGNLGQMPELLKSMNSASQIMSKPITDSLMMFTDYERPPEPQIIMAGVGGGQSPTVPPDDNQSTFIDNAFGGRPTEREKWNDIRYKFG